MFYEIVIAPGYTPEGLECLKVWGRARSLWVEGDDGMSRRQRPGRGMEQTMQGAGDACTSVRVCLCGCSLFQPCSPLPLPRIFQGKGRAL